MDPNADKFDADMFMRSITYGDYLPAIDNAVVSCGEDNAETLMRKRAYGEKYAVFLDAENPECRIYMRWP